MNWASHELEHVGRIVGMKDKDLQYSYALSTVNGMAHLRDALYELVTDPAYKEHKADLLKTHDKVIRVMKHLIKDFKVDLNTIRAFNTKKVLSNLNYLNDKKHTVKRSRKARSTRRR
jgi:hypothetical protein